MSEATGNLTPAESRPGSIPENRPVGGPGSAADGAPGDGSDGGLEGVAGVPDLAVAFVPGVMPGKWFFRWRDRNPGRVLAERPLETDAWREELTEGRAHACFVRLPPHPRRGVDDLPALRREFRAVELYAEQQVVVLPQDHELTLLEEVPVAELAEEVLLQDPATLPERERLRSREAAKADAPLPSMRHVKDAIDLVAAGLGLVVVPMSLARLHHRKDLVHRVVPDAATVPVALVWPQDLAEEREELVQDFVGVVRGRGLNSSRGTAAPPQPAKGPSGTKAGARSSGRSPRAGAGKGGNKGAGRGGGKGTGRGGRGKAPGRSKGRR